MAISRGGSTANIQHLPKNVHNLIYLIAIIYKLYIYIYIYKNYCEEML